MPVARVKESGIDLPLFLLVTVLVCFGAVMIYSSSHVTAMEKFDYSSHFLKKQLFALTLGGLALLFFTRLPYWKLRKLAWPLLVVSLLLLVAVLFSKPIHGARRWLDLWVVRFMPSEVAKFALIVFLAHIISERPERRESFTGGILPCLAALGVVDAFILLQPDFSTSVIVAAVAFYLMYVGCINILHLALTWATGLMLGIMVMLQEGYRMRRLLAWQDPLNPEYRYGISYQVVQSLIAVGSGGVFGVGLAQSREKFGYLPFQYNDYIFAIIGEELGLIGGLAVIGLFLLFLWRGMRVARGAPDLFGLLLAGGVVFHIGIQAFVNLAVVLNLVPSTGLPLPFISYSGTSIVVTLASVGVLLNVSRYSRNPDERSA